VRLSGRKIRQVCTGRLISCILINGKDNQEITITMSISSVEVQPLAVDVACSNEMLQVILADGREISVPIAWFPRLSDAAPKDRNDWTLIGGGLGIHWESVDEDVSVASLLRLR
jgi:hypothetical protein